MTSIRRRTSSRTAVMSLAVPLATALVLAGCGSDASQTSGAPVDATPTSAASSVASTPEPDATESTETTQAPEETPSASASPSPDSPAFFAASARGDLRDLRKDLRDLERALDEGGLFRMLGNVLELSFNVGQLGSLTPPLEIGGAWDDGLAELELSVDELSAAIENDAPLREVRERLTQVRERVDALGAVVDQLE